MSGTWKGSALLTRYSQKYGMVDTTSLARVLEWMNEIQEDIGSNYRWPFLKMKLKKLIPLGTSEIDLSIDIPSACTIASAVGGTLTNGSTYYVKTTFLIFNSKSTEEFSIESEPSLASNSVTISGSDKQLNLTSIDTMDGSTSYAPTTIHRRIYLKKDSGDYILSKTIENNTDTTTSILIDSTSTIEPPEYSMIDCIANEDPVFPELGRSLSLETEDNILKYDPNLSSSGTPSYYSRIGDSSIRLYPKLSAAKTLTYWVYKKPARIFNDSSRSVQLSPKLKKVLDSGVLWKGHEYKDESGQESKLSNYEMMMQEVYDSMTSISGKFQAVRSDD